MVVCKVPQSTATSRSHTFDVIFPFILKLPLRPSCNCESLAAAAT